MMLEYGLVIGRKEILRPAPRTFALDHRVDGDIADPELLHVVSLPFLRDSVAGEDWRFKLRERQRAADIFLCVSAKICWVGKAQRAHHSRARNKLVGTLRFAHPTNSQLRNPGAS